MGADEAEIGCEGGAASFCIVRLHNETRNLISIAGI
jgi:hypothetical protein